MDAATVIDGARSLDTSFSPSRHPDRVALEFLSRYQRVLAGKMLEVESRAISQEITFDLPLEDFAAGVVLQVETDPDVFVPLQYDRIHGIDLELGNGDRLPCGIIPWKGRAYADEWPIVAQRENTLLLMGRAADWSGFTALHLEYAPTPQLVATPEDELIFPESALNVLVLAVGAEWCRRSPEACERKTLPAEAVEAEAQFIDIIDERNDVEIGSVRRVFS